MKPIPSLLFSGRGLPGLGPIAGILEGVKDAQRAFGVISGLDGAGDGEGLRIVLIPELLVVRGW